MTYDFRCEKCGKLLKLRKDPGRRCRCPNCRGWTRVPALLHELPQPHVPLDMSGGEPFDSAQGEPGGAGDDGESDAAGAGRVINVRQEEPEEAGAVALSAVGSSMPWVFSAVLHVGLFLIMLFVMMLAQSAGAPVEPVAAFWESPDPPPRYDLKKPGSGDRTRASTPRFVRDYVRDTEVVLGPSLTQVNLTGNPNTHGRARYDEALWGGRGPGKGLYGIGDGEGTGGAENVVYVVDRSGSMARIFEEVKAEMVRSISRLDGKQRFHVVLFGDGETFEGPRTRLIPATMENKVAAGLFLREKTCRGTTTALVALKRAFAALAARPARETKLIYLVSDGDFSGISGGSEYRAGGKTLNGNEAVLQWLADHNKGPKVHVCTILLHSADKTAAGVLRRIAEENGGRFKYISPDE